MNDGTIGIWRGAGPEPRAETLGNGLTVLVRSVPGTEVAAVVTRVGAGYFDESDAEIGISHVLEHMYFKGTARRAPGDIGREIRAAGGFINAGTIYDRTSYYAVVPAEAVSQALDVHADALLNARIDPAELDRELKVIIEEVKRKRDTPSAMAQETLFATLFDRHRMRRWRMGTESGLALLDAGAVRSFYEAQYRPDNVIVSVAGDVDPDGVLGQVEGLFGDMPARSGRRERGPSEPERAEFRFREFDGNIHRTYITCGWQTRPPLHPDGPALDLLALILGQGRASRLYRRVRETGLVQQIAASHYTPTEIGIFTIAAVTEPDGARTALDAVAAVIAATLAAPVSEQELDRARRIAHARLLRRLETVEGQANLFAEWQALGDWRLLDAWLARMQAVSVADLHAVAARYLSIDRATVVVYRPESAGTVAWAPTPSMQPGDAPPPTVVQSARSVPADPASARASRLEDGIHFYEDGAATVVVLPRATAPLVSLAFAWGGGANEEKQPGMTTLVARTALKGSQSRDGGAIAEQVEGLGGIIGGSAGADAFEWTLNLPARHLADGLDLLCDVVHRPAFRATELEIERRAILGELSQVRDDMQGYPLRLMLESAFKGHRYGAPLEAFEKAASTATREDLVAWHTRTVLNRAGLALVVGDVDPDTAASAVLAVMDPAPREPPPSPPACLGAGRLSRVVQGKTAQTAIAIGFPGPARNHPDVDTLRVLAAAIGGLGGRLVEELRSRRSLAYTVFANPVARIAGGVFACYIATSPEREDEARGAILQEIARLAAERLPEADVERAVRYLIGSRRIRLQTHTARLGELAGALLLGRGLEEIRGFEERIRALGPEQLRCAAETWLDPERFAEAVVRGASPRQAHDESRAAVAASGARGDPGRRPVS